MTRCMASICSSMSRLVLGLGNHLLRGDDAGRDHHATGKAAAPVADFRAWSKRLLASSGAESGLWRCSETRGASSIAAHQEVDLERDGWRVGSMACLFHSSGSFDGMCCR